MTVIERSLLRDLILDRRLNWPVTLLTVILGSLILTFSAKFQVPFYPVPMTLQTGAVLLVGALLGPRLGSLTVLAYLAEGLAGLPVFAGSPEKGIGLAYLMGPTGGYLLGFVPAAFAMGWTVTQTRKWAPLMLGAILSMAIIYGFGSLWLATFVGWNQVIELGVAPFVLGDIAKIALVVAIVAAGTRLRKNNNA